ncbi:50S ribosomal protein L15 [Blattabacterium sp. DPU]|uniref:50S ribosomal protein L15 n=1 Tax=Blattabacterium sp. DPU TaxID=2715232 RepID=UPI001407C883|nr:50S ribosomal protein L15 [Blattabacterium sp. DPU]QIK16640.1 50S ribosomal protein L15 [Blattabacterium sp. DPU]
MDKNYLNISYLRPNNGSKKKKLRLGRGQGSGKGGTCGRGHKGAKSRSGFSKKKGFEGGQMPLQRRIPKFGFKRNLNNSKKIIGINLDTIQNCINHTTKEKDFVINKQFFIKKNLAKKNDFIKILGRGELHTSLKIHAYQFSKKALFCIKKVGGEAIFMQ